MNPPSAAPVRRPQLVAPAGSLAALRMALQHGADAVYLGLRDATNARNFGGLNFSEDDIRTGVAEAHARGAEVLFAINTFAQMGHVERWHHAVDAAAALGADAVIMADAGLIAYAAKRHPSLRIHLSVQGSATHADAIELMREQFGIRRVVLPRVLSVPQIAKLARQTDIELEVFGFGSLCVMAEGAACCRPTPPAIRPITRASARRPMRCAGTSRTARCRRDCPAS
jgi:putative protease